MWLGITAGIGSLHDNQRFITVRLQAVFPHSVRQTPKLAHVLPCNHQLMGAGTALGHGSDSFKPDHAGAAVGETVVAANGFFSGSAILHAVGALHGLKGDAIVNFVFCNLQTGKQRLNIGRKRNPYAQLLCAFFHFLQVFVVEGFMGHGSIPPFASFS